MVLVATVLALHLAAPGQTNPDTDMRVSDLRCENLEQPLAIETTAPRLSWKLSSTSRRSDRQTAYQVLVASSTELLGRDTGDLWDSGRVEASDTTAIEYAGRPLASGERCYWKVRVWDGRGDATPWSEPAQWGMGLLSPKDWTAQWIGFDAPSVRRDRGPKLDGAQWIGKPGEPPGQSPVGTRYFRARLIVPGAVKRASVVVAGDDRFRLFVNGELVASSDGQPDSWRRPVTVSLKSKLKAGTNLFALEAMNDFPGWAAAILKCVGTAENGEPFELVTNEGWRFSDRFQEGWNTETFDDANWPAAANLAEYGAGPWGRVQSTKLFLPPPRLLRKEFELQSRPVRATLYASALGIFDLRINGNRVHEDYFAPGWSDYRKRVYYRAYDVTRFLRPGKNAIAAVLADGWYAGYVAFGPTRERWGSKTRLLAQLDVLQHDGSRVVVGTGPDWKATTGPWLEADLLMGESYDARKEPARFDEAGFDDQTWHGVNVGDAPEILLQPHPGPAVRRFAEITPQSVNEPKPDVYVVDLGQYISGVVRLRLSGAAGQTIRIRYAERLNPDGTIYTANLRSARCTDTYVCSGSPGGEVFEPRFTFRGFQYVEIVGLSRKPERSEVLGIALGSDTPPVGSFECSDRMVNRLVSNIYWTQRANFLEVPTDCPQRDERLGWTGDIQVFCRTGAYFCDIQAFISKWLVDLADGQRADGQFPMVAPVITGLEDGGPAWADAGVIVPWNHFEMYGDVRALERQFPYMLKFIEFNRNRFTADLRPPEKFHCFGDWLNIEAETPHDVLYSAYFAKSADLTARAARVLGRTADAERLEALFGQLKEAFQRAYVSPDGRIKGETQTAYALAIDAGLLPDELVSVAGERLVEDLMKRGVRLSTGFVGTRDLMFALTKIGRSDLAYRLLLSKEFPSWGFTIENGATSIWERWNGWTPEKGFNDPGMNSFAHYAFGAVGEWLFRVVGGIEAVDPGFSRIRIQPHLGPGLTWARTSYNSIRGPIASVWRLQRDTLQMLVSIPPNCTAEVRIPTKDRTSVMEGGTKVESADGVEVLRQESDALVVEIGSGHYAFTAAAP